MELNNLYPEIEKRDKEEVIPMVQEAIEKIEAYEEIPPYLFGSLIAMKSILEFLDYAEI